MHTPWIPMHLLGVLKCDRWALHVTIIGSRRPFVKACPPGGTAGALGARSGKYPMAWRPLFAPGKNTYFPRLQVARDNSILSHIGQNRGKMEHRRCKTPEMAPLGAK
jgi:hypothetical protein